MQGCAVLLRAACFFNSHILLEGWMIVFFWPCSSYNFGGKRENLNGQCCLLSLLLHYCSEPICWRIPANEAQQPAKQSITYISHLEVIFIYVIVSCQGDVWAWAPRWKNVEGCYTVDIFPVGRTRGCCAALRAELPHNTTHVWKGRGGGGCCLVPYALRCQRYQPSFFMRRK